MADSRLSVRRNANAQDSGEQTSPEDAFESASVAKPDLEGPPAFYFDFADPWSYLAAERALATLPVATPWVPIDAAQLPAGHPWQFADEVSEGLEQAAVENVGAQLDLQPLRWPRQTPVDTSLALKAAWYAKSIGRVVSFSLPAFRQSFAGGHDISKETTVLLAASACEMHPRSVLQAFERKVIADQVQAATLRAIQRGVTRTPAVWLGDERGVVEGPDCLENAAQLIAG